MSREIIISSEEQPNSAEQESGPRDPTSVFPLDDDSLLGRVFDYGNTIDHALAYKALSGMKNRNLEGLICYLVESPRLVMAHHLRLELISLLQGQTVVEQRGRDKKSKKLGVQLGFLKPKSGSRLPSLDSDIVDTTRTRLTALFEFLLIQNSGGTTAAGHKAAACATGKSKNTIKDTITTRYLDALRRCVWLRVDGYRENAVLQIPRETDQALSLGDADITDSNRYGYRWFNNVLHKHGGGSVELSRLTINARDTSS